MVHEGITLNIQPPIALQFHQISAAQIASARAGICPHCVTQTIAPKHACEAIQFLQCSRCLVVVALEKL